MCGGSKVYALSEAAQCCLDMNICSRCELRSRKAGAALRPEIGLSTAGGLLVYLVIPGTKTFLPCWARLVYTRRAGAGGAAVRLGTLRAAVNGVPPYRGGAHWRNMGKCTALSLLANSGTEFSRLAVTRSGRARFPQPFPAAPIPLNSMPCP